MADLFSEVTSFFTAWNVESEYQFIDAADSFSSTYTILLTLLFGTILTAGNFILSPISCHAPVTFSGTNFEDFVDNYCWLEGSLVLKGKEMEESFPSSNAMWDKMYDSSRINFYPWVPLIVYGFSLISLLVFLIWKMSYRFGTAVDLQDVLDRAVRARNEEGENRAVSTRHIALLIQEMVMARCLRRLRRANSRSSVVHLWEATVGRLFERLNTSPLSAWYLGCKILFLVSHIGVLLYMHHVLQMTEDYRFFGLKVLGNLLSRRYWDESGIFPRVTFCRVPIRHSVRVSHVYAQCVLPINMLNEVIFVVLWFWYVAASIVMILSTVLWVARSMSVTSAAHFMKKLMMQAGIVSTTSKWRFAHNESLFLRNFLLADGVFCLRMIARNAGSGIAADVTSELWQLFSALKFGHQLPIPTPWKMFDLSVPSSSTESYDSDDRMEFLMMKTPNEQETLDRRT